MKDTKIVLVAEWDGWCGACADERPLVLTRRGRLGLRTWLSASITESRPLTLTCRLCGNSDVVPPEEDDPPVLVTPDEAPAWSQTVAPPVELDLAGARTATLPSGLPVAEAPLLAVGSSLAGGAASWTPLPVRPDPALDPALDRARGALGAALGALLAERTTQAGAAVLTPSVVPAPALTAAAVPLQRSASADADGLATLQLLADGLDLLSSSRS